MLSLLNNIILILCNLAPDPPVSSVTKDQPLGGEGLPRGVIQNTPQGKGEGEMI